VLLELLLTGTLLRTVDDELERLELLRELDDEDFAAEEFIHEDELLRVYVLLELRVF